MWLAPALGAQVAARLTVHSSTPYPKTNTTEPGLETAATVNRHTASALPHVPAITGLPERTTFGTAGSELSHPVSTAVRNATTQDINRTNACTGRCWFHGIGVRKDGWTKCPNETVVVIGRVHCIVDLDFNVITLSTSYSSQVTFAASGTLVTKAGSDIMAKGSHGFARHDTNDEGTVTKSFGNGEIVYVPRRRSVDAC